MAEDTWRWPRVSIANGGLTNSSAWSSCWCRADVLQDRLDEGIVMQGHRVLGDIKGHRESRQHCETARDCVLQEEGEVERQLFTDNSCWSAHIRKTTVPERVEP